MTVKQTPRMSQKKAAEVAISKRAVRIPVIGYEVPSLAHLAWYGGVAVLLGLEIIELPIALVLATGRLLADQHHSRTLKEFGEALEEAG